MKTFNSLALILLVACLKTVVTLYDITHYGAIQGQDTLAAQIANQKAFLKAIDLANSTNEV